VVVEGLGHTPALCKTHSSNTVWGVLTWVDVSPLSNARTSNGRIRDEAHACIVQDTQQQHSVGCVDMGGCEPTGQCKDKQRSYKG
jgi:hypothetical protein